MTRTIPAVVRDNAKRAPDSVAIISGQHSSTWAEVDTASNRVANGLLNLGIGPGSRVAIIGKNSQQWFEILFGVTKARAVLVPVNWRLAAPEIQYLLEDSGSEIVFADAEFADMARSVQQAVPNVKTVITIADSQDDPYGNWLSANPSVDPRCDADARAEDDALQLYTSGTTGRPKGALISHAYLFENFRLMPTVRSQFWKWEPTDSALVTAPLFHIGGINWAFIGAVQGCSLIVMRDFDPKLIMELTGTHSVPALPLVTPMLQIFLNAPGVEAVDFSRVRHVVYGSAPIPPTLLQRAIDVMGCGFVQMYGATESTIITVLDAEDHQLPPVPRMLSVGKPLAEVELAVVDRNDKPVPVGEIGEIVIKSPVILSGYWRLPDATAEAFRGEWFHTGDAGCLDDAGYVYLKDRMKDTIISGGENVYPAEVENALYEHPDVKEVAVVGIADDRWGEVPKAFVVLTAGASFSVEELRAFAAERLAKFKVPKEFESVEALPRNAAGKVLRRELRESAGVN
ncbi:long-chain-fatty-acid--CoA ligase [Mycobacterium kyogaense]|uniref:long-chain-fatty-acid--CoA ligase n=1 Tax=Mycobacterium kyogaense TaxID=2212479 RepID=UPI000DAC23FF|nr:long-chain-fatty-acid--CoA ligase [Mycobacterium kyogaense]